MAEAKLDITGSTAVAQRELDSLTRANAKLRESIRQTNLEWQQGAARTTRSHEGMIGTLNRYQKEQGSWSRGMATMISQNDEFRRAQIPVITTMERFGMAMSFVKTDANHLGGELGHTVQGIVAAGAAALSVEKIYAAWAEEIDRVREGHLALSLSLTKTLAEQGKLALGPQAEKFISEGVPGATPEEATAALGGVLQTGRKLTDQRTFEIAREIGKLAPTKIDLGQAGGLAGQIANLVGEGVPAEDIADLTVGIKQQLREKTEEFTGYRFQKALADLKVSKKLTGEETLAYGVAAARAEQGPAALKALAHKGPKSIDERRMIRESFEPQELERIRAEQEQFKAGGIAAEGLSRLEEYKQGRESLGEAQLSEEQKKTQEKLGPVYLERERQRRIIQERAYRSSGFRGSLASAMGFIAPIADIGAGPEAAGLNLARTAGQRSPLGAPLLTKKEVEEFTAALKEAAAASRAVAQKGASRNVDAHTE